MHLSRLCMCLPFPSLGLPSPSTTHTRLSLGFILSSIYMHAVILSSGRNFKSQSSLKLHLRKLLHCSATAPNGILKCRVLLHTTEAQPEIFNRPKPTVQLHARHHTQPQKNQPTRAHQTSIFAN
ncbi:hypothetical protein I3843_15G016600 [Carya illinoinensis]|nr:hypothetical protein I3843_15G016600 [Carya illinoinensis]